MHDILASICWNFGPGNDWNEELSDSYLYFLWNLQSSCWKIVHGVPITVCCPDPITLPISIPYSRGVLRWQFWHCPISNRRMLVTGSVLDWRSRRPRTLFCWVVHQRHGCVRYVSQRRSRRPTSTRWSVRERSDRRHIKNILYKGSAACKSVSSDICLTKRADRTKASEKAIESDLFLTVHTLRYNISEFVDGGRTASADIDLT
jgi:hypothetical protein